MERRAIAVRMNCMRTDVCCPDPGVGKYSSVEWTLNARRVRPARSAVIAARATARPTESEVRALFGRARSLSSAVSNFRLPCPERTRHAENVAPQHRPEVARVERARMRLQEEILTVDEPHATFPGWQWQPPRVLVQHLGNDLPIDGYRADRLFGAADFIAARAGDLLEQRRWYWQDAMCHDQQLDVRRRLEHREFAARWHPSLQVIEAERRAARGVVDQERFLGQRRHEDCNDAGGHRPKHRKLTPAFHAVIQHRRSTSACSLANIRQGPRYDSGNNV